MPKSKRKLQQQKDRKARVAQSVPSPESGISQPTTPRTVTTATARASVPAPTGAARHPYIAGELKKIGILIAILLAVLIILAFTVPRFI